MDNRTKRKRYRLHYKARKNGSLLVTREKTFYSPMGGGDSNRYEAELINEHGYVKQLTLT